jgi:hypothetical protein
MLQSKMDVLLYAFKATLYVPNATRVEHVADQSATPGMSKKLAAALARSGLSSEDQMSMTARMFAHMSVLDRLREGLSRSTFVNVVRHMCLRPEDWRPHCSQPRFLDLGALREVLTTSPLNRFVALAGDAWEPSAVSSLSDTDVHSAVVDVIHAPSGSNSSSSSSASNAQNGFESVTEDNRDSMLLMWLSLGQSAQVHSIAIAEQMKSIGAANERVSQELFNYCAGTRLETSTVAVGEVAGGLSLATSGITDALLGARMAILSAMTVATEALDWPAEPLPMLGDYDLAQLTNLPEGADLTDQSEWANACIDMGLRELVRNFLVLDSLSRALDIYSEAGVMPSSRPESIESWKALRTIRGQLQASLSAVAGYQGTNAALNLSAVPKTDLLTSPVMASVRDAAETLPEPIDAPTWRFTRKVEQQSEFAAAVMEQRMWWRRYRASTSLGASLGIVSGLRAAEEAQDCALALAMLDGFHAEVCDYYRGDWALEGQIAVEKTWDGRPVAGNYSDLYDKVLQVTHGWRGTARHHRGSKVPGSGLGDRDGGKKGQHITRIGRTSVVTAAGQQFSTMRSVRLMHTFFYHAVHCGISGHPSLLESAGIVAPPSLGFGNFAEDIPGMFRKQQPDICAAFDEWVGLTKACADVKREFECVIHRHSLLSCKVTGATTSLGKDGGTHGFPIRKKAPLLATSTPWIWSLRNLSVAALKSVYSDVKTLSSMVEACFDLFNRFMEGTVDGHDEVGTTIFLSTCLRGVMKQGSSSGASVASGRRASVSDMSSTAAPVTPGAKGSSQRRRSSFSTPNRHRSVTAADVDTGASKVLHD